jgi:hypothetical protein
MRSSCRTEEEEEEEAAAAHSGHTEGNPVRAYYIKQPHQNGHFLQLPLCLC